MSLDFELLFTQTRHSVVRLNGYINDVTPDHTGVLDYRMYEIEGCLRALEELNEELSFIKKMYFEKAYKVLNEYKEVDERLRGFGKKGERKREKKRLLGEFVSLAIPIVNRGGDACRKLEDNIELDKARRKIKRYETGVETYCQLKGISFLED